MRLLIILLLSLLPPQTIFSQESQRFHYKEFKWEIKLPEVFKIINSDEWLELKNKENAIKGYKLEDQTISKIILAASNDSLNYFVSYKEKNFSNSVGFINTQKIMHEISQQDIKVKVNKSDEKLKINNITFNYLKMEYIFPDGSIRITECYASVIKNKIFTIFITYNNKVKGELIHNAWINSKLN